ncbi:MAG: hypothetical protein GY847_04850 [Proteobacteria bacterium]|nr:hypothetical protein [Pseudomonadota bacterium]
MTSKILQVLLLEILIFSSVGCADDDDNSRGEPDEGSDTDTDIDMDTDADIDMDNDTDIDADSDSDADTDSNTDSDADSDADTEVDEDGICGATQGQLFSRSHPWNQNIESANLDTESDAIIAYLQEHRDDWGTFQIDGPSEEVNNQYGLTLLTGTEADRQGFEQTVDFYSPDCDPAPMPVPQGGAIEGEADYECTHNGDCHHIVVVEESCRLYEMWRANISGGTFYGGCQAVWDLTEEYTPELRGECCTSADAAGLPIAALTFTADDIAAGRINHALRFILPNDRIRERIYVRPATHSTGATSGPSDAPPYGARLRLKSTFDDSELNDAAKIVATALKRFGMIVADGGSITFTAANDRFTQNKWVDVNLGPHDLLSLDWIDFEVVELGSRMTWDSSCNCERATITNQLDVY